mmetsp:Transcript_67564/g.195573  ORF Transcript_67564/g.195573 Transcript_67564/m.195573 type:complete len:262 (+) Transcript_67564:129-914(+)
MDLDASGLELLEVLVRHAQLRVHGGKVLLRLASFELGLVLVQAELELCLVLLLLRSCGLRHEVVVLIRRGSFVRLGLGSQPDEVGLDHLEHANDTSFRVLHALVGLHRWYLSPLLDERSGGRRLTAVELLQNHQRLLHRLRPRNRVLDRRLVLGLLLSPELRGLAHSGGELRLFLRELLDRCGHLCDRSVIALNLGHELVRLGGLLVALQLVVLELLVAPSLVVCLGGCLLLQLRQQILDHLDDLPERVRRSLRGNLKQSL